MRKKIFVIENVRTHDRCFLKAQVTRSYEFLIPFSLRVGHCVIVCNLQQLWKSLLNV